MAKSSTRRVTIYINGKEVEAFAKQIRVEMNRLHNGQNRMVVVGDSATSYRRRRNDVHRRMRGREKMGGGERRSVASDTISAAHLFPLSPRARHVIPRDAQRRAEPPTNTFVSARTQDLHLAPDCNEKKYYFCTVEQSRMNHDRTYRPVPYAPALRLRDADGSLRPHTYGVRVCSCAAIATEPCRPTACAGEHPCCTFTHPATAHYSLLTANSSYTFSAKERDSETGLSYFGSRYYSSDLSVWLSVDPMSDKYPSLSPYTYCADNSVRVVDPNGEEIDPESLADNRLSLPLVTRGWMNLGAVAVRRGAQRLTEGDFICLFQYNQKDCPQCAEKRRGRLR